MKALVLTKYLHFEYLDVPDPEIGPDDVLVQVKACGICGSDIHGMDGSSGRRQPPIIMGHEAAGIITEVGSHVTDWAKGDRVTFDSTIYCGKCWFCQQNKINLCDHRMVLGVSCDDYRRQGAFADWVAIPQHILYRLPEKITFAQAATVEAVSVAFHAIERTPLSPHDTVVVIGTGMIGLLVVQLLKLTGCGQLIAVDNSPSRLNLARKLGADVVCKPDDGDVTQEILKLTHGRGADKVFEVVGIPPTFKTAIDVARKAGSVTLVGNVSPQVDLSLQSVVTREITLLGTCASCGEYPACLDLLARKKIYVDALLSATVPLAEGALWFKKLYDGQLDLLKVLLVP